jgi:hypothetical protein
MNYNENRKQYQASKPETYVFQTDLKPESEFCVNCPATVMQETRERWDIAPIFLDLGTRGGE